VQRPQRPVIAHLSRAPLVVRLFGAKDRLDARAFALE
jgi:hypothetical protein